MKKYTVESLLRPPVEIYSVIVISVSVILIHSSPSIFMLPTNVALGVSLVLTISLLIRLKQAIYVIKYQKGLRRSPLYKLKRSKIPVNKKMLFIGKGFEWSSKHTQRIHDAREDDAEKYVKKGRLFRWLRRKEIEWDDKFLLGKISYLTSSDSIFNPFRPLPEIGGEPMLHGVGVEDESNIYLSLKERSGHLLVKGSTGVGKTRLAELYITQDIRRKNNSVIVIDPKGDADLMLTTYLEAVKANRKCYIFHLGFPEYSAKYNALGSFSRITELPTRIASNLPGEGDAAAFREFVWQFVNVIVVAVTKLGEKVDYELVKRYMRSIDPLLVKYGKYWLNLNIGDWDEKYKGNLNRSKKSSSSKNNFKNREEDAIAMYYTLREYKVEDAIISGLLHAFQYEKTYFDKITNAVGPFLEKLTTGKVASILSPTYDDPNDNRPIIDWEAVLRQEAVVYVGLDALTDPEIAATVGSTMFSDLTSFAGRKTKYGLNPGLPVIGKENKPSLIIHGDEFNELIGPHMVTLLNKSRSADYQLNLYTQTWSDVEAKLGSAAKAGQIAGNLNTTIMMRVKDSNTADMLTKQLPETNVNTTMAVSGADDALADGEAGIRFKSRNEDRVSSVRVPLITNADIVGLSVGHAFALLGGSHIYKIRIPLIANNRPDKKLVPKYIKQMVDTMRDKYKSKDGWYHYNTSINVDMIKE